MAEQTSILKVGISGKGALVGAAEFRGATQSIKSDAKAMLGEIKQSSKDLYDSVFSLKTLFAGLAFGSLAKSVVSIAASYEGLRAALVTATKSVPAANAAFGELKKFADATPYTLEQATKAYIRMASAGLKPSIEALTDFGDIASSLPGKDILDFVEAVADATQGDGKRLKQFGIDLENMGDQVKLTFGDMKLVVDKNSKAIEGALRDIAKAQFGGSMERQSKTLAGMWSTLEDKASGLADEIGQGGLIDALKDVTASLTETAAGGGSTAQSIGYLLGGAIRGTAAIVKLFADNLEIIISLLIGLATAALVSSIPAIVSFGSTIIFISGQLVVATAAAGGFKAAMLSLAASNPLGWIVIAAAAIAEIVYNWDKLNAIKSTQPGNTSSNRIEYSTISTMGDDSGMGYTPDPYVAEEERKQKEESARLMIRYQDDFNRIATQGIGIAKEYTKEWKIFGVEASKSVGQTSEELNAFLKKKKEIEDTKKKASGLFAAAVADPTWMKEQNESADAAKQAAKNRADAVKGIQEQLRVQQEIYSTTISQGAKAALIEEKFQAAIAGKGFDSKRDAAQLAIIGETATALVNGEEAMQKYAAGIAAVAAASLAAEAAEQQRIDSKVDFFETLARETDQRERLAAAINRGVPAYEHEQKMISYENQLRAAGIELNEQQIKLLEEYVKKQEIADSIISKGQSGAKEKNKIDKQKSPIDGWIEQYTALISITKEWENIAVSGLNNFATTLNEALWTGQLDFAEFAKDLAKQITELLIKLALAAALKTAISAAGGGLPVIGGGSKLVTALIGGSFHEGGVVGEGGGTPRAVDSSWFSAAPRLHQGTIPGLRGDEYAAILQRGEEVLTRQQSARFNAYMPEWHKTSIGGAAEGRGGAGSSSEGAVRGQRKSKPSVAFVLPGVKDSRGFGRSTTQHRARMARMLKDVDDND